MFMALVTGLVVLFYCCVTADILTKLLQQCFLIFIVVPWLYLDNSQVSVYRTIGPTLVSFCYKIAESGVWARVGRVSRNTAIFYLRLRGNGSYFSFFDENDVSKLNSPRLDAAFCAVTSGAIQFAYVPY